jgi:hypothetical protein
MVLKDKRVWNPSGTCMSMKVHVLPSKSMVTNEQMKN